MWTSQRTGSNFFYLYLILFTPMLRVEYIFREQCAENFRMSVSRDYMEQFPLTVAVFSYIQSFWYTILFLERIRKLTFSSRRGNMKQILYNEKWYFRVFFSPGINLSSHLYECLFSCSRVSILHLNKELKFRGITDYSNILLSIFHINIFAIIKYCSCLQGNHVLMV